MTESGSGIGRILGAARGVAKRSDVPVRDTAWGTSGRIVDMVVGLASLALLARSIGPVQYGLFVGLFGLVGPISNFNQGGAQMATIESIGRLDEDPSSVFSSMTAWAMGTGIVLTPLVVLFGGEVVAGMPTIALVAIAVQELVFNAGVIAARATVLSSVSFAASAKLNIGLGLSRLALLIGLWIVGITLTRYAVGLLCVFAVWWLLSLGYLRRLGIGLGRVAPAFRHIRSMAVYGVGLVASGVRSSSDRTVLTANGFERDAGAYGAAYRLYELSRAPLEALAAATHVEIVKGTTPPWTRVRRAARLSMVSVAYASVAAVGLVVIAPVLPIVLGDDFSEASTILRWLAPIAILRSIGAFPANVLVGLGRNLDRTILQIGSAIIAVTLYVSLIPDRGWEGAVIATAIVEAVTLVMMWLVVLVRTRQAAASAD